MQQRKNYLINKDFQLRQTFAILSFMILPILGITIFIGFNAVHNNTELNRISVVNNKMTKNLDNILVQQDSIVGTTLTWALKPSKMPNKSVVKEVAQEHYKNIKTISNNINTIKKNIASENRIIQNNRIALIAIIVIIFIQTIIFYIVLIRRTHRVSGPLYVISNYFKEIINGKIPSQIRPLRKKDELKDFYKIFTRMIEVLNEREKNK